MAEEDPRKLADELLGEAVLLRAQGRLKEGMEKCRQALKSYPNNPAAFEILGDLYSQALLPDAAVEAYKRVLEIDPNNSTAEIKMARAALQGDALILQRQSAQDLVEGRTKFDRPRNPTTAGLLSFIMPGLGQAYNRHWLKAAVLLCLFVFFFLAATNTLLRALVVQQNQGVDSPDSFVAFALLFSSPTVWWVLLLIILYSYSIIDAALAAVRTPAEDSGLI